MKKTLLSSALTGAAGALALTVMLGAGPAFADETEIENVNANLNNNENETEATQVVDQSSDQYVARQYNRDESVEVEESFNGNRIDSDNYDVELENVGNEYELEVEKEWKYEDNSNEIEDLALVISTQELNATAAKAVGDGLGNGHDDIKTGDIDFDGSFEDAAGSMTVSSNTGLSSNAQAATAILANGDFEID